MSKGKSHSRTGRRDVIKTNAANLHRKTKQQAAKQRRQARYDKAAYDGSQGEES